MHEDFGKEIKPRELGEDEGLELMRSAAVLYKGEIFSSPLHFDARALCKEKFPDSDPNDVEEGYMTSDGKFLSKNEVNRMMDERDKQGW